MMRIRFSPSPRPFGRLVAGLTLAAVLGSCDDYSVEMQRRNEVAGDFLADALAEINAFHRETGRYPEKLTTHSDESDVDGVLVVEPEAVPEVARAPHYERTPQSKAGNVSPYCLGIRVRTVASLQSDDVLIYCPQEWWSRYEFINVYSTDVPSKMFRHGWLVDQYWVRLTPDRQLTIGVGL